MKIIPLVGALVGFLIVMYFTPWFIKFLKSIGLVVKDQNKENKPLIPVSGGLVVLAGLMAGLMSYIFIQTFFYKNTSPLMIVLASTTSLFLVTLIGFLDDLLIMESKDKSMGLKQWQKPLLTVVGAVPLMVIHAGNSTMWVPFLGEVQFGLIYPLILIPIIFVGASNMVNMLAGFNGFETGLGLIYIGNLGLFAYVNDRATAALIMSVPFFVEFILKARGRFQKQSYGTCENGKLKSLYTKVYSIPHFFTSKCIFTERQVVYLVMIIELVFAGLVWVV